MKINKQNPLGDLYILKKDPGILLQLITDLRGVHGTQLMKALASSTGRLPPTLNKHVYKPKEYTYIKTDPSMVDLNEILAQALTKTQARYSTESDPENTLFSYHVVFTHPAAESADFTERLKAFISENQRHPAFVENRSPSTALRGGPSLSNYFTCLPKDAPYLSIVKNSELSYEN